TLAPFPIKCHGLPTAWTYSGRTRAVSTRYSRCVGFDIDKFADLLECERCLNSIRKISQTSALDHVCSMTRRTRLMRSHGFQRPTSASVVFIPAGRISYPLLGRVARSNRRNAGEFLSHERCNAHERSGSRRRRTQRGHSPAPPG